MSRPHIVVVGDALIDRDIEGDATRLSPDAPVPVVDAHTVRSSPGGAALAALICRHDPLPADVTLIAPIAEDDKATEMLTGLRGVHVVALGHHGSTRTKTRIRVRGQVLLRVDDGGPGTPHAVAAGDLDEALDRADVVLVSDYGAGTTHDPHIRAALAAAAGTRPLIWDPHPRGGDPVAGAALVTPNMAEARAVLGDEVSAPDTLAADLREVWAAEAVAVTAGEQGAFLAENETGLYAPVQAVIDSRETCGAGDSFAASVAVAFAHGQGAARATVRAAYDARNWVARGGLPAFRRVADGTTTQLPDPIVVGEGPSDSQPSASRVAERVHRDGGRVVATGGCFDLLHAGHLATLEAARRLGDSLVVVINSDDSVRRLKGEGRPVIGQDDRLRMLLALRVVDGVEIFDEDDPSRILERVRPDVWVKGNEYAESDMPEAEVVRRHGGRVILLPRIPGRSTTEILEGVDRD